MKEIRLSDYAQLKMEVLASHEVTIDVDFVIEKGRSPDKLEIGEEDKLIAQDELYPVMKWEFYQLDTLVEYFEIQPR